MSSGFPPSGPVPPNPPQQPANPPPPQYAPPYGQPQYPPPPYPQYQQPVAPAGAPQAGAKVFAQAFGVSSGFLLGIMFVFVIIPMLLCGGCFVTMVMVTPPPTPTKSKTSSSSPADPPASPAPPPVDFSPDANPIQPGSAK